MYIGMFIKRNLKYIYTGILAAVLLYASWPLFEKGFIPTHDGEYHIIRFWQFYRMLSNGALFPRWAPDLNSGYGLPLFIFHYPFPNYIGAFFHLFGVTFVDSFKLALAIGYIFACASCFSWLKKLFSLFAATCAAIIFSVIPYWFVEIYVRGSVGEVWAIAWFFAALNAVEKKHPIILALCCALIIVSHNILAMLLIPTVFIYVFIRNRSLLVSVATGILLSSYFWLPAIFERGFMTGLNTVDYKDHFVQLFQLLIPSWGTGFSVREMTSDEMSFQIGIVPMFIMLFAMFCKATQLAKFFLILLCIAVVLTLEVSQPIWSWLGFMQFIQYPWRLLVFTLPVTAYLAASVVERCPRWLSVVLSILAVLFSTGYMRPVIYAPRNDEYYLTRPEFTDGTSSIGNSFSTIWTGWKKDRSLAKITTLGSAQITEKHIQPLTYDFMVNAKDDSKITVHTLYYPGWKVSVDGKDAAIDYEKQGIIEFDVSAGLHTVLVYFTQTLARKIGCFLSLFGWAILSLQYAYCHKYYTYVWRSQPAGDRAVYKRTRKRAR